MNHYLKKFGICMTCSVENRINSIELEVRNINRKIEEVLYLNNLTVRDLLSCKYAKTYPSLRPMSYSVHLHQSCGRCSIPSYNSFKQLETSMLNNFCYLIKYAETKNVQLKGLDELKRACRGFNYSSLYHIIERHQRDIYKIMNKNL